MQQEQKIKGFTILELLVVITIVSIVSAIGYPRFNDWKTDREVRQALERAASMVNSIITHTQRGSYPYVQIDIRSSQTQTIFTTKGMSKNKFSNSLNQKNISINCPITNQSASYWDADPLETATEAVSSNAGSSAAICFSREGSHYALVGNELIKNNDTSNKMSLDGFMVSQYIIFCSKSLAAANNDMCPRALTKKDKPAYLLQWSRFGNVVKYKWSGSAWNRQ